MFRRLIPAALAALALATPAAPATPTAPAQVDDLSVERLYGTQDFTADQVQVRWIDGAHYTVLEDDAAGRTDLYRVEARSGVRELLVRGAELSAPAGDRGMRIDDYAFSADRSKLLIFTDRERIWRHSTRGSYYVYDLAEKRLTPVSRRSGPQQYAKFSPDGSRVAFVRDHNIFVTELASGTETALTTDGDDNILNGTSDWVYEEELRLYDAFRWSPDGRRIAFWRFDQSRIPHFYLIDETKLYPELRPVRYPKAGTPNSEVRIGVIELPSGEVTWIDVGSDPESYIARMDFAHSPTEIWIQRLNRHQNRMDLLLADARTGRSRVSMTDTDRAWVDLNEPMWINQGRQFVYLSERDGYAQLFLFNRDGSLVRKLTTGEWDVLNVHGIDERRGLAYFSGAADGPLARPLYRVDLSGRNFTRLFDPIGTHQVDFSPTYDYYIDTFSRIGVPPVQTLRKADGSQVRVLVSNEALIERLNALGLRLPEFITVPLADGVELNGWIIKPPGFDPSKRYPLLMYVYGGPGSQTVTDSWERDRYLWHQILARQGYLVASVDNRGTGARGVEFKKITYLNLGKFESDDQIAAARYFADLPYVDGSRIGIWGWSYGGYMAALCVLLGNGVFKTAISVAPVTDWRLYDTIYTERFMRTPQENPEGYRKSAPLEYANRLQGRLLLVHGTGDDNVHPQNTLQLVRRLEEANKQFDLRLYPNKAHGITGARTRINLFTLLTDYVKQNL